MWAGRFTKRCVAIVASLALMSGALLMGGCEDTGYESPPPADPTQPGDPAPGYGEPGEEPANGEFPGEPANGELPGDPQPGGAAEPQTPPTIE